MLGYFVYKQFRQLLNFAFNGSVNLGSYPLTAASLIICFM
jgi:hypothetical protein